MKKMLLVILVSLLFSGDTHSQINGNLIFDGVNRSWIVYLPLNYNQGESLPLVLALHGYTQDGQEMMTFSDFNTIADTGNFVVVYPNGVGNAWNVGFPGGSTADDVGFLSVLIDTLHQRYNIDMNRVYSTGMSNGGFMSYRLACELGNRIAAIAPVAGTMTDGSFNSCSPQRQVPVLHIHGTADIVVNYNGGFGNKSVDQVLSFWIDQNNCPAIPVIENLPDLVAEGSTVQRQTWAPCDESTEVMLLKVINGGHTWPGSIGITGVGNTNRDIVASSEIWNFVKRFSLEVNTEVKFVETGRWKVYPNPANDNYLVIESSTGTSGTELWVFAADGKKVLEQSIPRGSAKIVVDISGLRTGIYLLRFRDSGFTTKFIK